MPHGGYHGYVQGLGQSNKPDTSAYKQAAQSMMSAGISNLSGSTTSDKKGKEAKKIQQNFQNNNNNNNNNNNKVDPIVPKSKPEPDEKKKELRLTIPGSDPDKDDRPKTGVTTEVNKAKNEGPNLFGNLNYNMDLTMPTSLMANENTITAPKLALQNDALKFSVEDFVMSNVPESLHDTVGASYAIVKAYIDQGFDFDVGKSGKVTLDWANDLSIQYNVEF